MNEELADAPGRLTPTGQGLMKAPPICVAPALKNVASSMDEFTELGVCFSPDEAATCAYNSWLACGIAREDASFRIETGDASFSWNRVQPDATASVGSLDAVVEKKSYVSSNSTVITNSSASSCGRVTAGDESSLAKDPPLEVVSTDSVVNSEDENIGGKDQKDIPPRGNCPASFLSNSFAGKLVRGRHSRQGRSLQRWLIHRRSGELVRQVAGCIPITRDGRIIVVSASRKTEWILPKGGWDADETKEECALRETFEEAGVLGQLGGCLEPIDYERRKAKKRRLVSLTGVGEIAKMDAAANCGNVTGGSERAEGQPSLPKLAKTETTLPDRFVFPSNVLPTGLELIASNEESKSTLPKQESSSGSVSQANPPSPDSENYSFVRLFLFPLYVSEVKDDWPEKGRLRKLVD